MTLSYLLCSIRSVAPMTAERMGREALGWDWNPLRLARPLRELTARERTDLIAYLTG
jgi:hypothetical protein